MTVALLALFVALGGTAAAAKILITSSSQIRNGVISRADLGKNIVDSKKVANGSLSPDDFDADARSALAQVGTQALEVTRGGGPEDVPDGEERVVATMSNIPPGAYAIFAKTVLTGTTTHGILGQGESVGGVCTLDADGDLDVGSTLIGAVGGNAPGAVNMQITRTFPGAGTAKVSCKVTKADWRASNTSIIALRVSAPTKQAVDGR
jgi:hypothetical protein